ncbi:MAG TPA: SatD family protein [Arachnia sp.]|nr:SatD family protein [Arachnia sp.]
MPSVVAVLLDVVSSRRSDRALQHQALLSAIADVNEAIPPLDPLRPTVGDEFQGLYATLGAALAATIRLRLLAAPHADLRAGIGGGEVRIIDEDRGIQDGTAWWLARAAIDAAELLASRPGYHGARTAIRDERSVAVPHADGLIRLVDSALGGLRPGVATTLLGLLDGQDNAEVARRQAISPSANSQRIANNDLRILADAITTLGELP